MTREERQILVNQYRILAILDKDNAKAHELDAEILRDGHEGLYDTVFSSLSNFTTAEAAEETHQILTMYRGIEHSLGKLKGESKKGLDIEALKFGGFDANDSGGHYTFARLLIERMRLYSECEKLYLNSHSSASLPKYRGMLVLYNSFPDKIHMTAEQLQQLIDAEGMW